MSWMDRYAKAYQHGHNFFRLPTWQLGRFAHAYADLTEFESEWTVTSFYDAWETGEFEPDSIGRYHHKSWFERRARKVA